MFNKSQFGRSMIEMLAVIAIVGLLSIVTFWGYEMLMARHRANQIIAQTDEIALGVEEQMELDVEYVDVRSYIPEGESVLTIAGYEAYFEESDFTTAFEITLEDVGKAVCEKIMSAAWDTPFAVLVNGVVDGSCAENNEITAAYNNTLENVNPCQHIVCPGETVCNLGECVCPDGRDLCNADTGLCCAADRVCTTSGDIAGTCRRNSNACTTNEDCKDAEGCEGITCWCRLTESSGYCEPLDDGIPLPSVRSDFPPMFSWKAGKFLRSTNNMTQFAAKNWCKAHHKRLVNLSDFNINLNTWNYPVSSGTGSGTKATTACDDAYEDRKCNLPQTSFLRTALNSVNFWTANDYSGNTGFAWYINFFADGMRIRVYQMKRNEINKALCK